MRSTPGKNKRNYKGKPKGKPEKRGRKKLSKSPEQIRLNRYIANAGVCSRREADGLISAGKITVNGQVVKELGTKINRTDKIQYEGRYLRSEKLVYVLLNKPKDFVTTVKDPHNRKTVMELVSRAGPERIYPVGRLDRNTTGILLFTNDGKLARKLTHPSMEIEKIYHLHLDKKVEDKDIDALLKGFKLEDGFIKADQASRIEKAGYDELGICLHSGRNRIIRRMMEHLGYKVIKLDRVLFAGLSKRDLPRGKFRHLTEREIGFLKKLVGRK